MPATIILDGEDLEAEQAGKHVVLGVALYNVEKDTLEFLICSASPIEEASAILKKFLTKGKIVK